MGLVVDKDIALRSPCHGYEIKETGERLLWSSGIVGMLSDTQEKVYCKPGITIHRKFALEKEVEHPLAKRLKAFKETVERVKTEVRAKYPKGERFLPYITKLGKELAKVGIKLGKHRETPGIVEIEKEIGEPIVEW